MFQEERHDQILNHLKENHSVRIAELSEHLGVTRETIRKDLYDLEKKGLIRKVHGGAVLNKTSEEPSYFARSTISLPEKELIAAKAAEFVEDGDSIYIDIGTTTLLFAKKIKAKNITVITNSVLAAMELNNREGAKIILSGGELRPGEMSLSGPIANQSLQNIYIDKAFIGVGGLSESGITDYHIGESELRRMMLVHAKERFALVDHSKVNVTAFFKSASVHELHVVITDKKTPAGMVEYLKNHGVKVIVVG